MTQTCFQSLNRKTLDAYERYIGKSDPYIVMVSTLNTPGGLFEKVEKEPEECTEHLKEDQIRVLYAEEFPDHPNSQDIVDKIFEIHRN
jgi:hypothetical protein